MQQKEDRPLLHTTCKNNLKLTKHTNMRAETVKLLEGNIGKNYCDPELDNSFSNVTHQKHKQQKKKYIDPN